MQPAADVLGTFAVAGEVSECPACARQRGEYRLSCIQCCLRLLKSAPRHHQKAMAAAIEMECGPEHLEAVRTAYAATLKAKNDGSLTG